MNDKKILIGVTGGIGSGKTTVCKMFETLGVPVYYADDRAKSLMTSNADLMGKIKSVFGKNSYNADATLNRKFIAEIIFNDKSKLAVINSLVHPKVREDFLKWAAMQDSKLVIQENALIFDNEYFDRFDYTIFVAAPQEVRIERVMKRDRVDRDKVLARIKNQKREEEKIEMVDSVIHNDDEHSLVKQVFEVYQKLLDFEK